MYNGRWRQSLSVTYPLWLLFATSFVYSTGDTMQDISANPLRLSVLHRVVLMPIVFGVSVARIRRCINPTRLFSGPLRFYFLYVVLAAGTSVLGLWPLYSMWKVFELVTTVLASVSVAIVAGPRRLCETLITMMGVGLAMVWMGVFISPTQGMSIGMRDGSPIPWQLTGWLIGWNGNSIGVFSALLILLSLALDWNPRMKTVWYSFIGLTLFLAQSRTSLGVLAVGVVLLAIKEHNRRWFTLVSLVCALSLALGKFYPEAAGSYLTRGKGFDSQLFRNASGRMPMWQYAFDHIEGHWITGFGFAAGSRYLMADYGRGDCATMENDFVDSLVSVGFLGPTLLAAAYLCNLATLVRLRNPDRLTLAASVGISALMVRSFTGIALASAGLYVAIFTCLAFVQVFGADDASYDRAQLLW